jgi:hypothetical protein
MTNTPRVKVALHAFRIAASGAVVAAAMSAAIAFTIRTGYPWPARAPSPVVVAAVWIGAAAIASAASIIAQRRAGMAWGRACAADTLTYLPLVLLWIGLLLRREAAAPLFVAVVAAVAFAKVALVSGGIRGHAVRLAERDFSRRVAAVLSGFAAVGRAVAPFALLALAARWQILHLWNGLALPEEGLLAHAAQAIRAGEVLYRDLRSVFAPGAPYLHAGMFAAFGQTLVVGKIALSAGPVLTTLAVYYVAQRTAPALIAFLAAALFALAGEGSLATFFALSAIGAGFARSGDRRANWMVAGLLSGAAMVFDVAVGAAAVAGLVVMLYLRQQPWIMRRVGSTDVDLALGLWVVAPLVLGVVIVWTPLLLYFASRGALAPMGSDLLSGLRGQVFAILRAPASVPEFAAPAIVYGIGIALLFGRLALRRMSEADFIALAVIIFGGIGSTWAWRTRDAYHLAMAAPALYVTATWLCGWSIRAVAQTLVGWPAAHGLRAMRAAGGVLILVGGALTSGAWMSTTVARVGAIARAAALVVPPEGWVPTGLTVAGGAYLPPEAATALVRVVDYVERHTRADEPIFCAPCGAAIYVLADRPHATRIDCSVDGQVPAGDAAEAVVALESEQVRLVVMASREASAGAAAVADPLIARYLARRYRVAARFGDYTVLLRKATERASPPAESRRPKPAPGPPPRMFGPAPEWKR